MGYGHSPLNPLCPSPKTEKFCFAFNNKSYAGNNMEEKDKKCTLKARCTLTSLSRQRRTGAPFGSPNTVYAVRLLHFALPYFAPLRSAKHRIYRNVVQNKPLQINY